jgi:hypothetical protein
MLTQISGIDAVTAHQVGDGHFDGKSVNTGGDGKYLVGGVRHDEV